MNEYSEEKMAYLTVQLRFAYYHFLVLSTYYIIRTNRFELSRLRVLVMEKCVQYVLNIRKVKQILSLIDKLLMIYYNYNLIIFIQKMFRYLQNSLTAVSRFIEIDLHAQAPRLGTLIFSKFFFLISLIQRVASSIELMRDNLMFDVRKVVALPVQIKNSISKCRDEIRNFWLQIEQIFLILRLPIELLSLVGRFLQNLISLISSIEKPKMPKL
ncbi:hypothetical protein BpHYR1_021784 [Brachionus plicatilis]|uniref:Uncharacterized protein n=1 Tax=Brachionus plicatilis TaxID=10195 RepID=A0A3M7P9D1_BRAPC|nr:hypothetical protein BpHYR1_021784 [Brachionus plicatilis]